MKKYIDVSSHQGTIDFNKLKGNVDGVILRAGYGQSHVDAQFQRNASECNRLGIPCGAYWFSYACNTSDANIEAKKFIETVKNYTMELPLAFDYEYDSVNYAKKQGITITASSVKNITTTFCQYVEKQGYYCMLYANPDFINKYFGEDLVKRYDLWLAQWPKTVDVNKPPRNCGIWQCGTSSVPGITGGVDTNEAYKDYSTYIRSIGCNHLTPPKTSASTVTTNTTVVPNSVDYMKWAKNLGLHDGTLPSKTITREEISKILYEFSKKSKLDL